MLYVCGKISYMLLLDVSIHFACAYIVGCSDIFLFARLLFLLHKIMNSICLRHQDVTFLQYVQVKKQFTSNWFHPNALKVDFK